MTTLPNNQPGEDKNQVRQGIIARAIQILSMFLLMGLELFIAAGTLSWIWAWVFLGIGLLSVCINSFFLLRTSPDMVAERGKPREFKSWDKWVSGGWIIGQYILLPVMCALDYRFGWTGEIPIGWHVLGAVGYALGLGLTGWAMITNAYFSTAVRIQSDRGQQVCTTGPYHYVRHPGYVGVFFQVLTVPLLLGSLWSLLFAIPISALMVIRTTLEDRMLQAELPGYLQYARQVRYRLIPGVW